MTLALGVVAVESSLANVHVFYLTQLWIVLRNSIHTNRSRAMNTLAQVRFISAKFCQLIKFNRPRLSPIVCMLVFFQITIHSELIDCTDFGSCSASCGGGIQTCGRSCQNGLWGSEECPSNMETNLRSCNDNACPGINIAFSIFCLEHK